MRGLCLSDVYMMMGLLYSFLLFFMQNDLSVSILRWPCVFSLLMATVMAASPTMLIVCLSFGDLMSICVTLCVRGSTTPAPSVLLPLTCEPPV